MQHIRHQRLCPCISALIYVVDSTNRDRIAEAYNELAKLLQEKELKEASLLIFANKQVRITFHHNCDGQNN